MIEARLGGTALRRYRPFLGRDPWETFVKEYEFDSLATMGETFDRFGADPEWQAVDAENLEKGITIEHRCEVFSLLPRE
jgi:hypothetical protein